MIVHCDYCKKDITLDAEAIETVIIDKIEVKYFNCNNCNKKYIISCINDYITKEQKRLHKLHQELNNADDKVDEAIARVKYYTCLQHLYTQSSRLKLDIEKKLK